jgi:UDP-glucose 4-epimerase
VRVMVTGGAGYIGSVVTKDLVGRGHAVTVYDNLSKGFAEAVSPGATLMVGDLLDADTLQSALNAHRIEAVVHLAASSLVGESMTEPGKYYRNNVTAGLVLLECMRDCGVGMLIFSSTAAVYGEPSKQPIEEADALAPTNPYGETKLAFERALHWYEIAHGLRHVSLRYFNAAGASDGCGERHEPETHLIPLVLQAAAGVRDEVLVFGDDYPTRDGTCVRDYIHVSDLARAHVLALEALEANRTPARAYNLGCGGDGYTVREVIETAGRVTNRPVPHRVVARRGGDPAVLIASSRHIQRDLQWQSSHQQLDTIVRSAWDWMSTRSPALRPGD